MKQTKWMIDFRVYVCKCNLLFWSRKHFVEHIKDTKRWKKYHQFVGIKCLVHKNGKTINEAFKGGQ